MKKLLVVLIFLGASLAGLAYWLSAPRQITVREELFTFGTVSRGEIVESVSATGAIKPKDTIVLTSETSGTVVEVLGDVNGIVAEGDTLVKLDGNLTQLKVEQAEIGVKAAQAVATQAVALRSAAEKSLKYQQDLDKGGFRKDLEKAEIELEAARASVKVAEAKLQAAQNQLKQAQYALEKMELKVPGSLTGLAIGLPGGPDGKPKKREYLVLERHVKVGQMVGPLGSDPLFVLAGNLSQIEVQTEVVEGDIGRVKAGQTARFTISSYDDPDLKFQGTVREIIPVPNNVKGAVYYNAVIDVANQKNLATNEWRLLPGMTTSVDIVVQQKPSAWRVPIAAMNFQLDAGYLSQAARDRLAEWELRPDARDWRPLWVWQPDAERVWPIFVRLNNSAKNQKGLQDGEFHEVLEWEPGTEPQVPDLRVIIGAPPARQPGLLERPANFKLS